MQLGDLIADKQYPNEDWGIIIYKDPHGDVNAYRVLCNTGTIMWFPKEYVENDCRNISEAK